MLGGAYVLYLVLFLDNLRRKIYEFGFLALILGAFNFFVGFGSSDTSTSQSDAGLDKR